MEPVRTRQKGSWIMESTGGKIEVEEIIETDYGQQGKTRVLIRKPNAQPVDYAGIDAVARRRGLTLIMPETAGGSGATTPPLRGTSPCTGEA